MLEDIRERVSRTLDLGPQIELSLDASRRFLSRHINKKIRLVVLIIDIAGSTQLSLTMPTKVLARIIQLFSQEMGLVANRYGGYVLKYVGDSVITFFPAEFDIQKACMNAIAAAKEMQIIIDKCINPELEKRSYPKIRTKISINVGSDLIVLYGKSPTSHIDIVGPTISVAAKVMLSAPPSSIIITEHVYNHLNVKELFKEIKQDNILLGDLKLYKASIKDTLEGYLDGKAIIYKAIDELGIDSINKPSLAIKKILDNTIKEGYDQEIYRVIAIALMHFMLSKFTLPSERKVTINNHIIDIVIPSSRVLKDNPKNALILAFPDEKFDIEGLLKIQPYKENIWIIFGYDADISKYKDFKVYMPDQFGKGIALSLIIDDINQFLKDKRIRDFKILPS